MDVLQPVVSLRTVKKTPTAGYVSRELNHVCDQKKCVMRL